MNKALLALTTLATVTVAPVVLAQEPTDDQEEPSPMPAPDESTTTITSAEPPQQQAVAPMTPLRDRETMVARQSIRPNRPLLMTGSMMLLGSYATTAGITAAADMRGLKADKDLYLPVVGPWLHLANVYEGTVDKALVVGSGVVQATGLAISILSLIVPEKIPAATIEAKGLKVNLTATSFGKGSAGFGAVGQF